MTRVQVLRAAKGIDAVAVTALGALRSLLGFGETLASLERRQLFELLTESPTPEVVRALESYLQRTFEFWNPNKERCWIRTEDGALEVISGQAPRSRTLSVDGDHLLLWSLPVASTDAGEATLPGADVESVRAALGDRSAAPSASVPSADAGMPSGSGRDRPTVGEGLPRDFPTRLADAGVTARRGEVYTFHWADTPSEAERRARVERAGAVRQRGAGLLVQPQYQAARVVLGVLPWPAWETDEER